MMETANSEQFQIDVDPDSVKMQGRIGNTLVRICDTYCRGQDAEKILEGLAEKLYWPMVQAELAKQKKIQ